MFYFCIHSKFQIHDYSGDANFPLSVSKGIIDLYSAGGNKISLDVPSGSGRYWIIGTFKGTDGLDGISIENTIVSQFNTDDYC